ncbi:MFS transporter [Alicyclobacillus sp. ALC3]|uniref:MFS transporter n=1 Tax=Alicyclobacillus sp. ALC3 TaxID=2796143 RepID=UPI00237876D8|nr:MFS transporter [Alicyclobacillus sp. ALC3]WDL98341.1 MFS transporter [Alicyclobacillus sp. ALC3]
MRGLLHSFSVRDYRWLWLITTLTNAGSWTFTLVVTWQSYQLTHSSAWSGAIMFATLIPNIFGAPIAGVLADLLDRRRMMFAAALAQVVVTVLLASLSHARLISPPWLLVLALVFGFSSSALSVLLSSLVPVIIPQEKLFNALSLQALAQRGTEFVGPAVASPLLVVFGPGIVYLFAALLYLAASACVFALQKTEADRDPSADIGRRRAFGPLIDGFAYIRRTPVIGVLVSLVGLHCALTMAYMGMLPGFVKTLHGATGLYGEMVSTVGLGSILGTLILAGVKSVKMRGTLYWVTAILSGLSLSLMAVVTNHQLVVLAVVVVGASQAMFMTLSLGYIQQMSVPNMRGRVTSFYLVLAGGFMSLANLGFGALSNTLSPVWIMGTTGILFMITVFIYGLSSRKFRSVCRWGVFEPEIPVTVSNLSV